MRPVPPVGHHLAAPAGCIVVLLLTASLDISAQSEGDVQVSGGVSTAAFTTPQGKIQVHVSADAAPGDTISGVVLAEPAGTTPQEQQANQGVLTGLVVELEGQQTKVADRQYEWTVPATLRTGRATITLRGAGGRVVSQLPVPVDPQPPLPAAGPGTVDLPRDLQAGRPATIRARSDGSLRGKTVEVGGSQAALLAASPRQVVFRVTEGAFGEVPVRYTDNGRTTEGRLRAMGVRLTADATQLIRGQRATLTTTVTGLGGLTEPATLSYRNLSPAIVQVEGREPRITIRPGDVRADGTYTDTRRLTGVQAGAFQIIASISRPALSRFDLQGTMTAVVNTWEMRAQFRINEGARAAIQRSILDARRPLEDFLRQQELNGADPRSVFQSLLSHYCYDLRDNRLTSNRSATGPATKQHDTARLAFGFNRIGAHMLAAARQQPAPTPEVTPNEVRRWSFSQFLSDLIARTTSQSIGYLFVTSSPERAGITIDGQRKSELTNRRFVTSVGNHDVLVDRPSKPCRLTVAISELQTSVVACE
jgi:hypothetical protein